MVWSKEGANPEPQKKEGEEQCQSRGHARLVQLGICSQWKIGDTVKTIFMYKNHFINLELNSEKRMFLVDSTILDYLIVDLAKFFHDLN